MKTKQYLFLASIALLGIFFTACDDNDEKGGKAVNVTVVEAVNISGDLFAINVTEDQPLQLNTFIMPVEAKDAAISFSFAGEPSGAIELTADGLVTPLLKTAPEGAIPLPLGTDTIIAKVEDGSGVYVKYPVRVISKIKLIESLIIQGGVSPEIPEGDIYNLQSLVRINPNNATDKSLSYVSRDTRIATVDENGNVTAVGTVGETTYIDIKANDRGGKSTSCKIIIVAK